MFNDAINFNVFHAFMHPQYRHLIINIRCHFYSTFVFSSYLSARNIHQSSEGRHVRAGTDHVIVLSAFIPVVYLAPFFGPTASDNRRNILLKHGQLHLVLFLAGYEHIFTNTVETTFHIQTVKSLNRQSHKSWLSKTGNYSINHYSYNIDTKITTWLHIVGTTNLYFDRERPVGQMIRVHL